MNPAGLTRLPHTQIVAIASIGYTVSEFEVKDGTTTSGGNPEDDNGFILIPAFYLSKPLSDKLRFGFTLNIPTGFGSDFGDTWAGRYISQKSSLVLVNLSPVLAYRINNRFSIGGGLNIVYESYESESAINNPAPQADGKVRLETEGFGVGFNIGALFELSSKTRFGFTYRSETEPDISGTPEFENLGPVRDAALRNAGVLGAEINADTKTPQNVQAGFYHDLTQELSFTADVMWIDLSEFGVEQVSVGNNSTSVSSQYKDIWGGSIGAKYRFSPDWAGAVGAVYLSEGVDDENRTIGFSFDRIIGFGVGIERQLNKKRRLHLNLNYYDLGKAPVDTQPTPLSGRVVGEYDKHFAIILDIGLVWDFLKD
jgi:long-chain fatty acid transport protein